MIEAVGEVFPYAKYQRDRLGHLGNDFQRCPQVQVKSRCQDARGDLQTGERESRTGDVESRRSGTQCCEAQRSCQEGSRLR